MDVLTSEQEERRGRRVAIFIEITQERERQEELAEQGRFNFTAASAGLTNAERLPMLTEELGEVARQVLQQPDSGLMPVTHAGTFDHFKATGILPGVTMAGGFDSDAGTVAGLRAELIQLAAIAVAWVEALDSRHGTTTHAPRPASGFEDSAWRPVTATEDSDPQAA